MILKKFFGKTIEAAQKSARQMLGDDFVVLEKVSANDDTSAQITVMSDKKDPSLQVPEQKKQSEPVSLQSNQDKSIRDKESTESRSTNSDPENGLKSVRRFAKEQLTGVEKESNVPVYFPTSTKDKEAEKTSFGGGKNVSQTENLYSRASIRSSKNNTRKTDFKPSDELAENESEAFNGTSFLTELNRIRKQDKRSSASSTNNAWEIKALHKRFDKLEALLDSALISSNIDYVAHPAFQQLIQSGISSGVVSAWFGDIIKAGIDPYEQSAVFMQKLAGLIREALGKAPETEGKKYQLFVGPSGAGKTRLIMRLSQHPEFMLHKKVAVATVLPDSPKKDCYYTILDSFCEDNTIPYWRIENSQNISELHQKWQDFDYVLLDSPSISLYKEEGFRNFWKVRQKLVALTPLEVHYVVNTSMNDYYFRHTSAAHHPLQPDFLALTHLDEISQWGSILPFLKQMDCLTKYMSTGSSGPDSLDTFDPRWFAKKLLQD